MASLEGIEAGALLGAYRVTERLKSGERAFFHAAPSSAPDAAVCLLELAPNEAEALAPIGKVHHAHLAGIREVFEQDGVSLLAFELVPGTTLTERLREIGKKTLVDAVGSALRVTDALSNVHDAGGAHGFVHTDSVVLDPPERLGPVLAFAPLRSDETTFHSPERGESGKPSVADDAWAVAGLLHKMLTGAPPPKDGYADEQGLLDAGVEDPALRAALLHGLNADPDARSGDVRPLKRELARWFVEHAGEEPVLVGPHSTHPPPLPGSPSVLPARVVASARVPRRRRRPPFAVIAVLGTLLGLGAAWAYSAYRKPSVQLVERPVEATAIATANANAIDLSEVPVTGEEQSVELDKTASCVAGYLPKGAFRKSPELSWLCSETDAYKGAQKLRSAIVSAAPKGGPTEAMKLISRIGWYDMAAYSVVRAACCEEPPPLTLAPPSKECEPMDVPLRDIGKEVVAGKSYEEPLKRYTTAIECEMDRGNGQTFGRVQRPLPGEAQAFRELVDAAQR